MEALWRYWAILAASVVGALALSFPQLWILAPLSLALFFYDLWHEVDSPRAALLHGLVFGAATALAGLWWIWNVLPFDWLGYADFSTGAYAVGIVWVVLSLILSIPVSLAGLFIYYTRSSPVSVFLTPLAWFFAEYGKMWAFGLMFYGNQGLLGPHFSLVAFGYLLAENDYLLQLAFPFGIWALTFLTASIGSFLAITVKEWRHFSWSTYTLALILVVALSLPLLSYSVPSTGTTLRVAAVSAKNTLGTPEEFANIYRALLVSTASSTPDIVVMPEGTVLNALVPPEKRAEFFASVFGTRDVLVATGGHVTDTDGTERSILYYDTATTTLATYRRIFLMPIGQYLPLIPGLLFQHFAEAKVSNYFLTWPFVSRGDTLVATAYQGVTIGGLLCSDSVSPYLSKQLANNSGARIIINPSNPTWFHVSPSLYRKELEIAKVHAVESRVYYVEATKGSASFIVSPRGDVITESPWDADSYAVADLTL